MDDDRVGIGSRDQGDEFKVGAARRGNPLVHDRPMGEGDIGRGEGSAVMPADILAKREVNDRLGLEGAFLFTLFERREGEWVKVGSGQDAEDTFRFCQPRLGKDNNELLSIDLNIQERKFLDRTRRYTAKSITT